MMHSGVLKKPSGVVRVVSIHKQQTVASGGFCCRHLVEVLDPLNSDLSICPSLLRISQPMPMIDIV